MDRIILSDVPFRASGCFGVAVAQTAPTCDFSAPRRARSGSSVALAKKIAGLLWFWRSSWPPELDFEASWPLLGPFWEAETPVFRFVWLRSCVRRVLRPKATKHRKKWYRTHIGAAARQAKNNQNSSSDRSCQGSTLRTRSVATSARHRSVSGSV